MRALSSLALLKTPPNLLHFLSMNTYDVTVRMFIKRLDMLKKILAKAEAFTKEGGMSEETLLNDRFAPDMYPLKRQVQLASDHAKGLVAKLVGTQNPKMKDTEETFVQLQERLDKTIAFLQSVTEADVNNVDIDALKIERKKFPGKYLTGTDYALEYSLPNFYFHITTAYDLLRKNGVTLGKVDFLNGYTLRDL